jgi:uncharacterized protein
MIRIVPDTSVLVSAVISSAGPNAQLFDFIISRQIRPYVTEAILEEYSRVFQYDRLKHLDKRRVARFLSVMERAAVHVKSPGRLKISSHDDDNRIYECAAAAKAHYIVTENARHFKKPHKGTQIVSARRLLELMGD